MVKTNEHEQANDQKWSRRAKTFDEKKFDFFRYLQKKLLAILPLSPNTNFLDIGCGTGWAVCHVATLLKEQGQFIGVDISKGMIEKAHQNASAFKNVAFFNASAEELPLEADFFDYIICTNSFHHYLHPLTALSEIHRVLKPGGRIYILDVTADDFFVQWVNQKVSQKEKEHVKFYNTAEYQRMFSQVGLDHRKSRFIGGYPIKVHIAEK